MVGAIAVAGDVRFLEGIKDSKKLSKKRREEWSKKILLEEEKTNNTRLDSSARQVNIAIVSVSPAVIDKFGISQSLKISVAKCLKILVLPDDQYNIFLDGSLYAPEKYINQQTIVRGDEKIPIISAASVIAKVYRDNMMQKLHKKYPQYGFDMHKGYGTAYHIKAIKKHGLCELHRHSFCKKFI